MTTAPRSQRLLMAAAIIVATAAGIAGASCWLPRDPPDGLSPGLASLPFPLLFPPFLPTPHQSGLPPVLHSRSRPAAPTCTDVFDRPALRHRLGRAVHRQPGDFACCSGPSPAPARRSPTTPRRAGGSRCPRRGLRPGWRCGSRPPAGPSRGAPRRRSWPPGSRSSPFSRRGRRCGRPPEARVPLLALIAYGIGGLLAAAVHPQELGPGAGGYLAGLLIIVGVPRWCSSAERRADISSGIERWS